MKVLTFSIKSAVIVTLVSIALIVVSIVLFFGGDKKENSIAPEIEIVLPDGVDG